nr:MAG TPA: hypothetical protein [Bacteriophage sp.]
MWTVVSNSQYKIIEVIDIYMSEFSKLHLL